MKDQITIAINLEAAFTEFIQDPSHYRRARLEAYIQQYFDFVDEAWQAVGELEQANITELTS